MKTALASVFDFYKKNRFAFSIFLFSLLLILLSLGLLFLGGSEEPVQEFNLEVSFEVGDSLGFDVNKSALSFGRVPPGSDSSRGVRIDSDYSFPVRVLIFASEEVASYLSTSQESFVIEPGESAGIPFVLSIPEDMAMGNYSGNVKFELWRER